MNYSEIKTTDIANGPGARTSLFVSGCRRHCRNCFNPDTWSFSAGEPYTCETQDYILSTIEPEYIHGITLLGGEPMEPENQPEVSALIDAFRDKFGDTKNIWMFSGFTIEEMVDPDNEVNTEHTMNILSKIDVLVDGPYEDSLHNIALRFRGSSNQRVIDVRQSLDRHQVVLWEDDPVFAAHEKEQQMRMKNIEQMSGGKSSEEELEAEESKSSELPL